MIRIATENDLPEILNVYRPYVEAGTASFEYVAPDMAEFTHRFRQITVQYPWIVWEEAGEVLGYAYGSAFKGRAGYNWCAETSIYVRGDCHGRGIGKKLYEALEKLLFAQGYEVLYAIITDENEGSIKFHRVLGYEQVAHLPNCGWKFGRHLGIVYLEKRVVFGNSPSENPVPWCQFVKNDGNLDAILDILPLS